MKQRDYDLKPQSERLKVLSQVAGRNVVQLLAAEMVKLENRLSKIEGILRNHPAVREQVEKELGVPSW